MNPDFVDLLRAFIAGRAAFVRNKRAIGRGLRGPAEAGHYVRKLMSGTNERNESNNPNENDSNDPNDPNDVCL